MRKAINHLKKADPVMRRIIERVGPYRMQYDEPRFHSLAEAIVYQQLHGKAAATIFKRLTDLAGHPATPAGILKLTEVQSHPSWHEMLRSGLPRIHSFPL